MGKLCGRTLARWRWNGRKKCDSNVPFSCLMSEVQKFVAIPNPLYVLYFLIAFKGNKKGVEGELFTSEASNWRYFCTSTTLRFLWGGMYFIFSRENLWKFIARNPTMIMLNKDWCCFFYSFLSQNKKKASLQVEKIGWLKVLVSINQ